MATKRPTAKKEESAPASDVPTPAPAKKRPAPLTAAEERKQGAVNMLAGIIITLAIIYLLYTVSGLIPKPPSVDEMTADMDDYDSAPPEHAHMHHHDHDHDHDHDHGSHGHSHDD
eukprot:comp9469_c0_seq2/m.4515 comp9469_c0_seq2/g.4515  ORF comp9469_c0_seq2/g.4515 comp9469_c0_seq2/m.4515 type:complete len:115 (-) comp9469_c0_seq2:515-859(-)